MYASGLVCLMHNSDEHCYTMEITEDLDFMDGSLVASFLKTNVHKSAEHDVVRRLKATRAGMEARILSNRALARPRGTLWLLHPPTATGDARVGVEEALKEVGFDLQELTRISDGGGRSTATTGTVFIAPLAEPVDHEKEADRRKQAQEGNTFPTQIHETVVQPQASDDRFHHVQPGVRLEIPLVDISDPDQLAYYGLVMVDAADTAFFIEADPINKMTPFVACAFGDNYSNAIAGGMYLEKHRT